MDEKERVIRLRFMQDFEFYAPRCLKIKPAAGGLVPLTPTEQQKKLHAVAERQLREKGRVRIIVAKGRKTKTSTYVQGRFFWKVTHRKGTQAYVIAHDKKTTDEIFSMADRFYRHCPPLLRPTASQNSVTSMKFEEIDSDYAVGTAGSLNVGRGYSPQLLHGSELGFWPKGEEIARGLITAVADEPGTEVWLESTGNGPGDYFHSQVMAALAGQSDYEVVFLEWWLEPEYSSSEEISPTEKEQELLKSYPGLTLGNLAWRRKRIASYGGDKRAEMLFTREYPMSIAEVFSQAEGSFIEPELVTDAAKRQPDDVPGGSVVVGIDPGGGGEDPTGFTARKGGHLFYVENLHEADPDTLAGKLIKRLEELQPKATFVDNIGVGYHLVGKLSAKIPGVRGIDFRRTAIEEQRFANKRAESYSNLKEWLKTASIPDNELLKIELSAFKYKYRANGQLEIESKDKARERGVKSPNLADAAALSLSEPVEQSQLDDTLWNIWPFKPRKGKAGAENLPDCNFITAYAWLSDEQWAIAAVGVFVPDTDRMKQADQKTELPNAIILKYVTGDGPYHFMDACHKLYKLYEPDYFYVPTRATILMKDLRIKNLTIRRAKFDTVGDVVAVATDVLKDRVGWVRNTSSGRQIVSRLARYPHGTDEALYGCIGLALAHLKQRGDIAVQFEEPEEPPRRRRDRRTAY